MQGIQGFRIEAVKVFLIAPPMVCWGLERLVQTAHPRMELVGSAGSIGAALAGMDKQKPDVAVIELESDDDLVVFQQLRAKPGLHTIAVTGSHDVALLDKAVLSGARGVVRTYDAPESLLKAIEKVHDGEIWIDRSAVTRIFMEMARQKSAEADNPEKSKISTLTARERQTIAAVTGDASAPAKVIARRLCISEHTLRNHLTSIYSKLDLTSRLDLYAYAMRNGLVGPS